MPMFAVLPAGATDPKITAGISRMIAAIANNERASAEKSLTALQSLGLDTQLSAEDLRAIKDRIQRL